MQNFSRKKLLNKNCQPKDNSQTKCKEKIMT